MQIVVVVALVFIIRAIRKHSTVNAARTLPHKPRYSIPSQTGPEVIIYEPKQPAPVVTEKEARRRMAEQQKQADRERREADRARREEERQRKEAQAREIALADIERWRSLKETYLRLLEAIETELTDCTDARRITTLLTRQANTEAKLHNLDRRMEKAYQIAYSDNYKED